MLRGRKEKKLSDDAERCQAVQGVLKRAMGSLMYTDSERL